MPIKVITRVMGVGRNTVRWALAAEGPRQYRRAAQGWGGDEGEPPGRGLLQAFPQMAATVIAERVGREHGIAMLKNRIRELPPLYLPPDPSGVRNIGWKLV